MGEYYKPVCLDSKEWLNCYDYDSLAKLMEHGWMRNPLVNAVMRLLTPDERWYKSRIVWAGDYDEEKRFVHPSTVRGYVNWYKKAYTEYYEHDPNSAFPNLYSVCHEGEYYKNKPAITFTSFKKVNDEPLSNTEMKEFIYLINHTKKQFVDLSKCPDNDGWIVHPLPVLTAGSFSGGGTYHPESEYKGTWKGHRLSAEKEAPEGYKEIIPNFHE